MAEEKELRYDPAAIEEIIARPHVFDTESASDRIPEGFGGNLEPLLNVARMAC